MNIFSKIDPVSLFIWVLGCGVGLFLFTNPLAVGLLSLTLIFTILVDKSFSLKEILTAAPLVLLIPTCLFFFHMVSHDGEPIFNISFLSISKEGLNQGAVLSFRVFFVILASMIFLKTADIRELLVGLVQLKIPYKFAFLIYLSFRYIPLIAKAKENIKNAIFIRCGRSKINLRWRLKFWVRYIFLLIFDSLRISHQTADAMDLRGFGLSNNPKFITPFNSSWRGPILLTFSTIYGFLVYQYLN